MCKSWVFSFREMAQDMRGTGSTCDFYCQWAQGHWMKSLVAATPCCNGMEGLQRAGFVTDVSMN